LSSPAVAAQNGTTLLGAGRRRVVRRAPPRHCEQCGFGAKRITLRVADGKPGVECQIDFGRLGVMHDPDTGRRRAVHALIFTAVYSRHVFVHLSFTQTLEAVLSGCERAWEFFGGVFAVLIPDNMSPIIASADPINPTFTVGWLDYVQARGFATDPARVRSPKDKPRVERTVQYVRENFWRGEEFTDLAHAQARVELWCRTTAGMRIHGTTAQRPAEDFTASESPVRCRGQVAAVPAAPGMPRRAAPANGRWTPGRRLATMGRPWFNKRPGEAYALTATDAYYWHASCPCQRPQPRGWRQISGRGPEGVRSATWMDWLWRTHVEPRGFVLRRGGSRRVYDVELLSAHDESRLRDSITSGPVGPEPAPVPPFDPTKDKGL